MQKWISTKERLPEPNKYVLARHNRGTWIDADDQKNVNCVVVKMVKGLSKEDRQKMKDGILPDEDCKGYCKSDGWTTYKRSNTFRSEDEEGNNLVPYNWEQFGPDSFFGQTITHWMSIPELDESDEQT